jgi:hypothetical protein
MGACDERLHRKVRGMMWLVAIFERKLRQDVATDYSALRLTPGRLASLHVAAEDWGVQ